VYCVFAKVINGLEPSMMEQLRASVLGKQRFGVGFQLAESWDFMQMKVGRPIYSTSIRLFIEIF